MKNIAFTLCSNNYLAQAKTLGDSVKKHNPDIHFVIGLVDKLHPDIDYSFFRDMEILPFYELGYDEFDEMVEKYNIVEFNTAVKPFYFEYIFEHHQCDTVTYFDPDIKIFDSLQPLYDIYDQYDFVLTPHLLKASPDIVPEKEQLLLNVGIYNLGFLGLKRSDGTKTFIKFFKNRLRDKCYIDFNKGLYVDQIWANFIPSYFDKVYIWKDYGCNVGYWNFCERQLSKKENKYYVNSSDPLLFFHVSNYYPDKPEMLCKFLSYSFEERPDLVALYEEYRHEILNNNYKQYCSLKPLLNFKQNHFSFNKRKYNKWNKIGLRLRKYSNKIVNTIFNI